MCHTTSTIYDAGVILLRYIILDGNFDFNEAGLLDDCNSTRSGRCSPPAGMTRTNGV